MRRNPKLSPDSVRRVLVFRIGELGDTIVALPAFWELRRHFPSAHLCLLSNNLQAPDGMRSHSVLPDEGLFDSYLHYPSSTSGTSWGSAVHLYQQLAKGRFDLLVYLSPRLRSPVQVQRDLLFFRAAGIRRVIGHDGIERLPQLAEQEAIPSVQHETDHLLSRLETGGIPVNANGVPSMDLLLQPAERQRAAAWLEAQRVPPDRPLVGFGPGARRSTKLWPEDRYKELGLRLIREQNVHPVIFSGPEDAATGQRLIEAWGRGSNAAGVLGVREAAAALERCALYIGNDTGTTHLAAAVGTTCVAIFSAQDWPGKWHPYGAGHIVLRRNVPCTGCRLDTCTTNGLRCLTEIEVNDVYQCCAVELQRRNAPAKNGQYRGSYALPVL